MLAELGLALPPRSGLEASDPIGVVECDCDADQAEKASE